MEPPSQQRAATVRFNVGGRIFEVLREPTLSLHPDSLLCQLAEDSNQGEAIFIEANGDLFQHMLDFHRHRKIHIPFTTSKDAIMQEARALGLTLKPEDVVQEAAPLRELGACAEKSRKDLNEEAHQSLRQGKVATLGALILKCLAGMIGRSATIAVTTDEIVKMEGVVVKTCLYGTSTSGCKYGPSCPSSSQVDVNTFSQTMRFLCQGVPVSELAKFLQPWGSRNGYWVEIDTIQSTDTFSDHRYSGFRCIFS